ncbi:MAG: prepilin-type N-terminal cleavage/methylation domain-containing protein [Desulfobacterales bacterium]
MSENRSQKINSTIADCGLRPATSSAESIADFISQKRRPPALPCSNYGQGRWNWKCALSARSRQAAATGFTLMEVLVAITILAIVVTTILASFNSVFSTTEVLDENADLYAMAKNCMQRMVLDLESIHIAQRPIYKPPELDQPPDPYRIVATTEDVGGTGFAQIRFASRAHVGLENSPREGIAEIIYYVQSRDDGHLALKRADNLYPYPDFEENGSDPVLSKYVKSLAFKFYDPEGLEYDVWDSDSDEFGYATPKAIAIRLELANKSATQTFETRVLLPLLREKTE